MMRMSEKELSQLVDFFHLAGKLKEEKRKGWVDRGVKDAESVSDHSYRMALMALVFSKRQSLDVCKCVKMSLVHDLPEAICGDVATRIKEELQKIPNREKEERERNAMESMASSLPEALGKEIKSLWEEFEAMQTKEARLVYELDRLEAIFQAVEYEAKGNFEVSLQEFYDYANARLENKEARQVFELLMKQRKK